MLLLWSATPMYFSGGQNISYAPDARTDADDDILIAWFLLLGGVYE